MSCLGECKDLSSIHQALHLKILEGQLPRLFFLHTTVEDEELEIKTECICMWKWIWWLTGSISTFIKIEWIFMMSLLTLGRNCNWTNHFPWYDNQWAANIWLLYLALEQIHFSLTERYLCKNKYLYSISKWDKFYFM